MSEQEKDAVQETEQEESSTSTEEESTEKTQEEESEESTVESKTVPYDRFKEVNDELKKLKQDRLDSVSKKPEKKAAPKNESLSEEDLFAIKQLDDKDSLDYARKVAKLEDISLSEAIENPLFKSWQTNRVDEKKKEDSQMGASRGSGSRGKKKDFATPGVSPTDHKEMWKRKAGIV